MLTWSSLDGQVKFDSHAPPCSNDAPREAGGEVLTLRLPPNSSVGVELRNVARNLWVVDSVSLTSSSYGILLPDDIILRDGHHEGRAGRLLSGDQSPLTVTVARGFEARSFDCVSRFSAEFRGPMQQLQVESMDKITGTKAAGVLRVSSPWRERHADQSAFFKYQQLLTASVFTEIIAEGDLLLSINNKPVDSPEKVEEVLKDIRSKCTERSEPFAASFEVARPMPEEGCGWHQVALVRGGKTVQAKRVAGERTDWKQHRNPGLTEQLTREPAVKTARAMVEPLLIEPLIIRA